MEVSIAELLGFQREDQIRKLMIKFVMTTIAFCAWSVFLIPSVSAQQNATRTVELIEDSLLEAHRATMSLKIPGTKMTSEDANWKVEIYNNGDVLATIIDKREGVAMTATQLT